MIIWCRSRHICRTYSVFAGLSAPNGSDLLWHCSCSRFYAMALPLLSARIKLDGKRIFDCFFLFHDAVCFPLHRPAVGTRLQILNWIVCFSAANFYVAHRSLPTNIDERNGCLPQLTLNSNRVNFIRFDENQIMSFRATCHTFMHTVLLCANLRMQSEFKIAMKRADSVVAAVRYQFQGCALHRAHSMGTGQFWHKTIQFSLNRHFATTWRSIESIWVVNGLNIGPLDVVTWTSD